MKYKIEWSPSARRDFQQIVAYVHDNYGTPAVASIVRRILKRIDQLDTLPHANPRCVYPPWYEQGILVCFVEKYNIYFRVDDVTKTVEVIMVVYGARDIAALIADRVVPENVKPVANI